MEINKHNYQEIKSVREGDRIVFNKDCVYIVTAQYLKGVNIDNETIFRKIGVMDQKMDFCKKAYGYKPYEGFCPEYKWHDYDAALRLIRKIFDKMYPELKKKGETTTPDTFDSLDVIHESSSKSIKTNTSNIKFTIKVSTIKPKIIL